ncbi:MAG: aminotransferase class I/II-fold pyridoxal phosphate-dependent enzyme [Microthrixaceae bacterium]
MSGFVPPPYPYDRLAALLDTAARRAGGAVDLSVGTPCDDPPGMVLAAMAEVGDHRRYPPSIGTEAYREACAGWISRRFGVAVSPDPRSGVAGVAGLAACVGTKEFVAGLPQWLHLRRPDRDTVLYPATAYPTYEMGARLAGLRPVPVPVDDRWCLDLDAVEPEDRARALCLWVNSPANPTGAIDDLTAAAEWGRRYDVDVFSDECYAEFTWLGEPRTIIDTGVERVVALHSLSKRSNLAGARAGFYVGDPDLVRYLAEVRQHVGLMVPGPVQAGGAVAWSDDAHVEVQRARYRDRLRRLVEILGLVGIAANPPEGAFYLWVESPDGDGWSLAHRLAEEVGLVVSPGEFYGPAGARHVRIAAVATEAALDLLDARTAGLP